MSIHPDQLGELLIRTLYSCPALVGVRDAVYQTGPGSVDKANCEGPTPKGPCVGVVVGKPSLTTCYVVQQGLISGFPSSTFTPAETLFLGRDGAIVNAAALPSTSGTMIQELGYAKSDSELMLSLDRDYYTI